jgi:hypothetical protein
MLKYVPAGFILKSQNWHMNSLKMEWITGEPSK